MFLQDIDNSITRPGNPGQNASSSPDRTGLRSFQDQVGFVDIHCHCLPGVDDGPSTMNEALELCRALICDGINSVVATPHDLGCYDVPNHSARIRAAHVALVDHLKQLELPLAVHVGAEVRLDERIPKLIEENRLFRFGHQRNHLLLEMPGDVAVDLRPLIQRLSKIGIHVIVAHPERHRFVSAEPEVVRSWLAAGARIQLTAGSLCGDFGRTAEATAWRLLDAGLAHFIATDAHDVQRRPPRLRNAYDLICATLTPAVAQRVCLDNPRRLVFGEEPQRGWRTAKAVNGSAPPRTFVGRSACLGNLPRGLR